MQATAILYTHDELIFSCFVGQEVGRGKRAMCGHSGPLRGLTDCDPFAVRMFGALTRYDPVRDSITGYKVSSLPTSSSVANNLPLDSSCMTRPGQMNGQYSYRSDLGAKAGCKVEAAGQSCSALQSHTNLALMQGRYQPSWWLELRNVSPN